MESAAGISAVAAGAVSGAAFAVVSGACWALSGFDCVESAVVASSGVEALPFVCDESDAEVVVGSYEVIS